MKLIDKDVAVKIAERYGLGSGSVLGRHSGIADAIASEIDSMEQIDPVHAAGGVYCWECIYRVKNCKGMECRLDLATSIRYETDFCSQGIKKGE